MNFIPTGLETLKSLLKSDLEFWTAESSNLGQIGRKRKAHALTTDCEAFQQNSEILRFKILVMIVAEVSYLPKRALITLGQTASSNVRKQFQRSINKNLYRNTLLHLNYKLFSKKPT